MNVEITGLGAAVPANKITNHDLSKKLNTSDEWISTRTGIKSRYHANSLIEITSKLAYEAGKAAIKSIDNNKNAFKNFDALILATTTPDRSCPATAPKVAYDLGLGNISAFDINAVCSGFIYGLELAEALIKSGKSKKLLLIGADVFSKTLNSNDRTTFPLFGDAAGAMVLESSIEQNHLMSTITYSDGKYQDLITVKDGFFKMDGKEVFTKAVSGMKESVIEILSRNKLSLKDIDLLVPHQANLRIINILSDILELEKNKVLLSLEEYGNTSAASIPLTLAKGCVENKIKAGDKIVVTAFGGGLTWGSGLFSWPSRKITSEIILVK